MQFVYNEVAMYQPTPRTTLDGEWLEDELQSDIYDVCIEVMTPELLKKYEFRALKDTSILKPQSMYERILDIVGDVVQLYNKEYDKHRHEKCDGIKWYDETIAKMIHRELKENLVK